MIKLTCVCGAEFERPESYEVYNKKYPNVVWRWKLKYCDTCFKSKADNAIRHLPNIINSILKDDTTI